MFQEGCFGIYLSIYLTLLARYLYNQVRDPPYHCAIKAMNGVLLRERTSFIGIDKV